MELPFVDEHDAVIDASPEAVWRVLGRYVARMTERVPSLGMRLLGVEPSRAQGVPPEVGSSVAGFSVVRAEPGRLLELRGRHRFSEYALTFILEPEGGGTRLRATTRAAFPGPAGGVYRALVIGSRVHVLAVRKMLGDVSRRA